MTKNDSCVYIGRMYATEEGNGKIETMNFYQSKCRQLAGTDYSEVTKNARKEYAKVQKLTKRQPYVRSKYFSKDKVFITIFWNHLVQKRKGEQIVRAKLLLAAFDLLRNTTCEPESLFENGDALHRFYGKTADGIEFAVQVKHDLKTGVKTSCQSFRSRRTRQRKYVIKNKTLRWVA